MAKFRLQAPSGFVYETDSATVANDLQVDKGYKRLDLPESKARKAPKRRATILTDKVNEDVERAENEGMTSTNHDSPVADEK